MLSKPHFYISLWKSGIRIFSCLMSLASKNLSYIAIGFALAEILGILEEIYDER